MSNFDIFIELVKDKGRAPSGRYTDFRRSKTYERNALVDWLCKCADNASYDMRRIDEDPQKKAELMSAIGIVITIGSGGSIPADIGEYVIGQLVTDAANQYMQTHPSVLEAVGHWLRKPTA